VTNSLNEVNRIARALQVVVRVRLNQGGKIQVLIIAGRAEPSDAQLEVIQTLVNAAANPAQRRGGRTDSFGAPQRR
jgi:hypothetical protein